jgi:hypothetical protein
MADETIPGTSEINIDANVDQLLSNLPVSSISRAIGNNLYGLNLRQTGNPVPRAKDAYGFTFFTRPQLNLSRLNISNYRGFYNLLNDNHNSYQTYTRLMLDPRLAANSDIKCPFVDIQNPFIPILTNNIVSLSGWPDLAVPSYTSPSGLYGQEHSFVDGITNHYEAFDLDVTFRNTKGNPLLYFFYIWVKYESLVFEGILNPYMDMIVENEIDYNTRIYRIVLDQQKRYVTYIGATGASFPINVPTGNLFDYNTDTPYNTKNTEINIRFRSMGFLAFEDILKLEFNKTLAIFNKELAKVLEHDMDDSISDAEKARDDGSVVYRVSGCKYVKVPYYIALSMDNDIYSNPFFSINYRAYPYINLVTSELEFWVDETRFQKSAQSSFEQAMAEREASGQPIEYDEGD